MVDREGQHPVWDMYEWVTCGMRIKLAKREITIYDKGEAVQRFHCLSNRSHEDAWAVNNLMHEKCPELLKNRYEKTSERYWEKVFRDWLEIVILPDGTVSPLYSDCSTEEGIRQVKKHVQDWLAAKEGEERRKL